MLRYAGRPVQRIELMKWCFLLRHESETRGGNSFYGFVPYLFGPFSFAMYQEIEKLSSTNYVVCHGERDWKLNPDLRYDISGVSTGVEREIMRIIREFGGLSNESLLEYVYQHHPAYTVNSERQKLVSRKKAKLSVYTAGYEGVCIDEFLNLFVDTGIERVIDVRSNPIARRYGFHKRTFARLLGHLSIEYQHFAELGIQSEVRRLYPPDGDRKDMFDQYEAITLKHQVTSIEEVSQLVNQKPSVLVCMEGNPSNCHRSRLANSVSQLTGLPIVHLGIN